MSSALTVAFVVGVTPGKWARVWAERLPEHPLGLLPATADEAFAGLDEGTVDLAFVRVPVDGERWHTIALYDETTVVVVPRDHAIEAVDAVTTADLAAETLLEGPWQETIALVGANVGVALMPQSVARALSRRDVVARPVTDAPVTTVGLVWSRERTDSLTAPLIEEFIGVVRGRTARSSRGTGAPVAPVPPNAEPRRTSPAERRSSRRPKRGR